MAATFAYWFNKRAGESTLIKHLLIQTHTKGFALVEFEWILKADWDFNRLHRRVVKCTDKHDAESQLQNLITESHNSGWKLWSEEKSVNFST